MLKGKQKNLDVNKDGKISGKDFAILKAEKAKGRGMGLQDEELPPGKMVKAKSGKIMSDGVTKKGIGIEKKMGGGMIDPTMSNYKHGGSVVAKVKLGKTRPTKLY